MERQRPEADGGAGVGRRPAAQEASGSRPLERTEKRGFIRLKGGAREKKKRNNREGFFGWVRETGCGRRDSNARRWVCRRGGGRGVEARALKRGIHFGNRVLVRYPTINRSDPTAPRGIRRAGARSLSFHVQFFVWPSSPSCLFFCGSFYCCSVARHRFIFFSPLRC